MMAYIGQLLNRTFIEAVALERADLLYDGESSLASNTRYCWRVDVLHHLGQSRSVMLLLLPVSKHVSLETRIRLQVVIDTRP